MPSASNSPTASSVVTNPRLVGASFACDAEAWVDLERARNQPSIAAQRELWMGSAHAGALSALQSAGIDIEPLSRGARMCELQTALGARSHVVWFSGTYPADLTERIIKAAPNARRAESIFGPSVQVGQMQLVETATELVWSDSPSALESALEGKLQSATLQRETLLSVNMMGARAKPALASLASGLEVDPESFRGFGLSIARDGTHSEVRIMTRSADDASALLGSVKSAIEDAQDNPHTARLPGMDRLSAEAVDATVALRCRASLEDFLKLLTHLQHSGRKASR